MSNPPESVRILWNSTDEAFFRIAAELFPPPFLSGAGVLLASYDPEPQPVETPAVPQAPAELLGVTAPLAA